MVTEMVTACRARRLAKEDGAGQGDSRSAPRSVPSRSQSSRVRNFVAKHDRGAEGVAVGSMGAIALSAIVISALSGSPIPVASRVVIPTLTPTRPPTPTQVPTLSPTPTSVPSQRTTPSPTPRFSATPGQNTPVETPTRHPKTVKPTKTPSPSGSCQVVPPGRPDHRWLFVIGSVVFLWGAVRFARWWLPESTSSERARW